MGSHKRADTLLSPAASRGRFAKLPSLLVIAPGDQPASLVMFVFFQFIVVVLMMNLIIAIMGESDQHDVDVTQRFSGTTGHEPRPPARAAIQTSTTLPALAPAPTVPSQDST